MILFILGGVLLAIGGSLDLFFRERMTDLGYKWALLQGGAFNYKNYHTERKKHGWSAWPVYIMWVTMTAGIAMLIAAFVIYFPAVPKHR